MLFVVFNFVIFFLKDAVFNEIFSLSLRV